MKKTPITLAEAIRHRPNINLKNIVPVMIVLSSSFNDGDAILSGDFLVNVYGTGLDSTAEIRNHGDTVYTPDANGDLFEGRVSTDQLENYSVTGTVCIIGFKFKS